MKCAPAKRLRLCVVYLYINVCYSMNITIDITLKYSPLNQNDKYRYIRYLYTSQTSLLVFYKTKTKSLDKLKSVLFFVGYQAITLRIKLSV